MSALQGKRVLVTRAAEDRGALDDLLASRGAEVVSLPCISFAPPADRASLDAAIGLLRAGVAPQFVVLASAHAVDRFASELRSAGLDPALVLKGVGIAVAGPGTARRVAELGLSARTPDRGAGAEALATMLAPDVGGKDVLVPRAEGGNPALVQRLQEAGARVAAVTLYRTVSQATPDPGAERALRDGRVDAIAFASGSAARGFADLFGTEAPGLARTCRIACMGRACAEEARARGLPVDAVADGGFPELVHAMEGLFGRPLLR
jgi:uroporphyrinogen III methyltransferase/synthase